MLRDDLEVEVHVERRPEASGAWARLYSWLLSEDEDHADCDDRGRQKSTEVKSEDASES